MYFFNTECRSCHISLWYLKCKTFVICIALTVGGQFTIQVLLYMLYVFKTDSHRLLYLHMNISCHHFIGVWLFLAKRNENGVMLHLDILEFQQ